MARGQNHLPGAQREYPGHFVPQTAIRPGDQNGFHLLSEILLHFQKGERVRHGMKLPFALVILGSLFYLPGSIATGQEPNQLTPVPIESVIVEDAFWSPKRKVWQEISIPDCFSKFEKDRGGAFNNF